MVNLSKTLSSIQQDPFVKEVFSLASEEIYLVGGFIRDVLLNRESPDRDFVTKDDPLELAEKIKKRFNATLVVFRGTVRVVLEKKQTLDFTAMFHSIDSDLRRRDFTINAMAVSRDGTFVDPFSGLRDLKKGLIRATSEKTFIDDPVRVLRAFRFISELGFEIVNDTFHQIKRHRHLIKHSPVERITFEFFKLLGGKYPFRAIQRADEAGLLTSIFHFKSTSSKEILRNLSKSLQRLKASPYVFELSPPPSGFTPEGFFILQTLLYFSEEYLLRLPGRIIRRNELFKRCTLSGEPFDVFTSCEDVLPEALIFHDRVELFEEARRYLSVRKKPLITGEDLIALGLRPGPQFQTLLKEALRAQYSGQITSREQAIEFLKKIL